MPSADRALIPRKQIRGPYWCEQDGQADRKSGLVVEVQRRRCDICEELFIVSGNRGKARAATGHLEKPELFDLVSLDFVGPRKFGRLQRWILVLFDHYSRDNTGDG
eukprot:GHVN01102180.1.p2 GENE.GHVN01102180.1~~GHVN01102180.1.p2  ORF type:complete len:106 (-),score=9.73 GHVN01102180.1:601-918(-)